MNCPHCASTTPKERTKNTSLGYCKRYHDRGSSSHLGILALESYFFSTRSGW